MCALYEISGTYIMLGLVAVCW